MSATLRVNQRTARRFLLDRLLLPAKPARRLKCSASDVLQTIQQLECVQLDPVAAVERNQHLVLYARLPGYRPALLEQLLDSGSVFEFWANAACVIPMEDYAMFELTRARRRERLKSELDKLGPVVKDVLNQIERDGPLPSKAFESNERVHGYWDNTHPKTKATSHALNLLNDIGLLQVVKREGTTRFFDVCERAVPKRYLDEARAINHTEAREALIDKYIRAYRLFDATDSRFGWTRLSAAERRNAVQTRVESGVLIPVEVDGVKKEYYILSEDEPLLQNAHITKDQTTRFLPPLDNLLWRRDRVFDLFNFSYTWEVYIPAAKRKYGYYAMPILVGDQIIGRIDPRVNRSTNTLHVELFQIEPNLRLTKGVQAKVFAALEKFAAFHGATLGHIEKVEPPGILHS